MLHPLYTIGYHSFSPEKMITLLKEHHIGALADIRAWPSSRLYPDFNAASFAPFLRKHGIYHLCMGENLGVRPVDPSFYSANRVDYEKIASSPGFCHDLERLYKGVQKFPVCLMCKEADPAFCHRAILVAWQFNLRYPAVPVWHFLENGNIISQMQLDEQLMEGKGNKIAWLIPEDFDRERTKAYRKRGEKIAWKKPSTQ